MAQCPPLAAPLLLIHQKTMTKFRLTTVTDVVDFSSKETSVYESGDSEMRKIDILPPILNLLNFQI